MQLLTRIKYRPTELVVGAAYLLGELYVITEESSNVLVYTGYSPYDLIRMIPVDGMIAVDIVTSYVHVCVYILDNGNGRVSRIEDEDTVTTFIDGLERGNLLSMSVNNEGRLTIVQKNSRVLTYDADGNVLPDLSSPIENIRHAVEVDDGAFVICTEETTVKVTNDGKEICRQDAVGCRYVDVNRNGDLIACNSSGHQIVKLNHETLQVTATLLTLDRDGIESPRHVRCVLENGLMLVSWMNFLDMYSVRETDTGGYLASAEHDVRNQGIREVCELENEALQTAFLIKASETRSFPQPFGIPCTPSISKDRFFHVPQIYCTVLRTLVLYCSTVVAFEICY